MAGQQTTTDPTTTPSAPTPVAITVSADVTSWLNMLNDASAPPFFKTPGVFSKPAPSPDATDPLNTNKYEITYTESSKKTTIAIEIDPKTNQSTFSVKDPAVATAQDYTAITLAAIQASVASIKPPSKKAGPIHFDGFTQADTACFEGVKAAVQAYYFKCLTQTPPVKPTIEIQSADPEANKLLQAAIKDGQQAAFDQIKQKQATVDALEKTIKPLPDNMDKLLAALDTTKTPQSSDVVACQTRAVIPKSPAPVVTTKLLPSPSSSSLTPAASTLAQGSSPPRRNTLP